MRELKGPSRGCPLGGMKVKAGLNGPRREDAPPRRCYPARAALPGRLPSHRETRRAKSVHVGTREMMNYTWSG